MSVRPFHDLDPAERLEADICIVGSGPAGATLAGELAGSGIDILVLESGGVGSDDFADTLNEIENVGALRQIDQRLVRQRRLGGTSVTWSGRCAPLDAIDYQPRAWVPHSGWPIDMDDLEPFLRRSAIHLGLGVGTRYADTGPNMEGLRPSSPFQSGLLRPFFWQFSQDGQRRGEFMRFNRVLQDRNQNIRILTNATVLQIISDVDARRVVGLEITGESGRRSMVRTRTVLLCAGGIENARLLLASNRIVSMGLGNAHDQVGRYLMDHPRGSVGAFDPSAAGRLGGQLSLRLLPTPSGIRLFCRGLRLAPEVQASEGLLNCAVWLSELVGEDDPWSAAKRLASGRGRLGRDLGHIGAHLPMVASGLWKSVVRGGAISRKLDGLELNCTVEQLPDPDSRVTLSDRVDRHGTPLSRIDWRVSDREQHTVRRMAELVGSELTRCGLPALMLESWVKEGGGFPRSFGDVAHHIGTTRMSVDPHQGVVDPNCEVHGINGLFVAGSSVFPTAGHANPTQTIVALAVRLADHLRQRNWRHESAPHVHRELA